MARHASSLRAALVVILVLAALPASARAVAPAPTVTFVSFQSAALPGEHVHYEVDVTPTDAAGSVELEESLDGGSTWHGITVMSPFGLSQFSALEQAPIAPVTRQLRATFASSTPDYVDASSAPQTQFIAKATSQISNLTAQANAGPVLPGSPWVDLWVGLSGIGEVPGTLTFEEDVDGSWVELGLVVPVPHADSAGITATGPLGDGTHPIRVTYAGDGQSTPATTTFQLEVPKSASAIEVGDPGVIESGHPIQLIAQAGPGYSSVGMPSGLFTISENGVVLASSTTSEVVANLAGRPAGMYTFSVAEAGDANYLASSAQFSITVIGDSVHASASPLSTTTVFPYRDGYRDSVTASGTRDEPVSVGFTVKNASGKTVRTGSVPSGTLSYHWTWNGRTAAGAQVAAGSYTIVTVFRDAGGKTKTVKQAVKVSAKRLVLVTDNLYKSPSQTERKTSSWGAWKFTLPTAYAYKGIRLYFKGHARVSVPPSGYGTHDLDRCPFTVIDPDCIAVFYEVGATEKWWSAPVAASARSGRHVRAYIWAGPNHGKVVVERVRLRVRYTVLK